MWGAEMSQAATTVGARGLNRTGLFTPTILQECRRLWQAFGHALAILRSRPEPPDEPRDPQDSACEALLMEVAARHHRERQVLARHVAQLWKAFHTTFGGLDGFLTAMPERRSTYFAQLADFVARCPSDAAGRRNLMALAAAVMAAYLQNLGRDAPPEFVRRLGVETVQLIGSGRASSVSGVSDMKGA